MKKLSAILLAIALCAVLCSCESQHDKVNQQFDEAYAAYQEQKLKVDILQTKLDILDLIIDSAGK